MFTGLVEGLGSIVRMRPQGPDARLWIKPVWPLNEVVMGESVAVNGACLTVSGLAEDAFAADVSAETLGRTTLGRLQSNSPVNLERALRLCDRLGGHLVSGHVDCLGQIRAITPLGASLRLTLALPPAHMRYVAEKGSITIDGVSLTVNEVSHDSLSVNIIPHTAGRTALQLVKTGQYVNIETDLLAKYLEKLAGGGTGLKGLSLESLAQMGY